MNNTSTLEEKILEYWFTLEFLGQDKYPQKELKDAANGVRSHKEKLKKGQNGYKSAFHFFEIEPNTNLYEAIRQEAKQCRMEKWGNITVYIGKVKREACIKCIAKGLPFGNKQEERPERNWDDIACASIQLTPEGKYVEHSLSLSAIIWAMTQIKNSTGMISDCLEEAAYKQTLANMEELFFKKKADAELEADAVNTDTFVKIYNHIEKTYLKGNVEQIEGENPYELIIGISFQMFIDEKTRSTEDDDNYLGLSHDYFSDDLKMILEQVRKGTANVPEQVLEYITSTYKASMPSGEKGRIDLIHPSDSQTFEEQVQKILNVRNAPIGKWPSKYMPAFMQQVAINLAIKKGNSTIFKENGEVFSVNGPPGTGKTTLLKEIIVNNIIERALLLAKYDNPDEAFDKHSFLHGKRTNNAYSQYTQHWYSLKEEKINEYSILVTSCNNAAVENISKELPLESEILKALKPGGEDSDEVKSALKEVEELFDSSKSCDIETYEKGTVEAPDIYFTYYAQKLLSEKNVWGLVAASLGKKKNIRDFYKWVLSPLRWDFYPARDSALNRLPQYLEAKRVFLEQAERVRKMQDEIAGISELACHKLEWGSKKEQTEEEYRRYQIMSESEKGKSEQAIEEIRERITEKEKEKQNILNAKTALNCKIQELDLKIKESEQEIRQLHQDEYQTINSVGRKPWFFGKDEYEMKLEAAKKVAEDYKRQAEIQSANNEQWQNEKQGLAREYETAGIAAVKLEKELTGLWSELEKLNNGIDILDKSLEYKKQCAEEAAMKLEETTAEYEAVLKNVEHGTVLNGEFIKALLSGDRDASTEAQVSNPWFTMQFNREREKLFYYAMKLNKAFILASKKCRDNFTSLAHYWGLQTGDEKEKVVFHKEDREACAGALYQTLFLLVPVISTTFASVGTFLKDVKRSGVIGTLIVDEAGQAQPQMAVGALYRSKKAIVVGDPKQVEPVVTDDLKLLKNAFDDEALKAYTSNKTISVQSCADEMNVFGTWLENPEHPDFPDWIGCPLLVHRRCISPMYEISNAISYNGIMKKKTNPPSDKLEVTFIYEKSQWIQTKGKEKGNKNHFVEAQALKVCEMLETAFGKSEFPSVYIISPFTTVVAEIRSYIKTYKRKHPASNLAKSQKLDDWIFKNIGTVHTFQGKEANEVIFLLGCDGSKGAEGAVRWVNSNIVNVAVTRAKYRLYIVGDETVWSENQNLRMAKTILDTFAIQEIHSILTDERLSGELRENALKKAAQDLPPVTAFEVESEEWENGEAEYRICADGFAKSLEVYSFMKDPLTTEQLRKFGFSSEIELLKLDEKIRTNLELGMRLYYFLQPVYKAHPRFDASCCAILFCKAMEQQMKECFVKGLGEIFPDTEIQGKGRKKIKLGAAEKEQFTLGTFRYILEKKKALLEQHMIRKNEPQYDSVWWSAFCEKLQKYTKMRNQCCHDGVFLWKNLSSLLAGMFLKSGDFPVLDGLMFESKVGKKLGSEET